MTRFLTTCELFLKILEESEPVVVIVGLVEEPDVSTTSQQLKL